MKNFLKFKIHRLINIFEFNNFKCFVVGGCVRDLLLGIPTTDFDLCTNATPDQIKLLFNKFIDIGEKNGCIKIFFENEWFEITTFRREKDYIDFRHPNSIEFLDSPFEDSFRRDFKINAMYLNLKEFIDPFNGLKDLKNKIISTIGNPNVKFYEDPIRILRGIYLKSKLNFKIEFLTLIGMKNNIYLLSKITKFRIHEELNKIFINKFSIECIKLLNSLKSFQVIFKYDFKIYNLENIIKIDKFHIEIFCLLYFHSNIPKNLIINIINENLNFNKKCLMELSYLINNISDFKYNHIFIKKIIYIYDYDFSETLFKILDFYVSSGILNKFYEIKWGYSPIKLSHLKIPPFKFLKNKKNIKKINSYILTLSHKYPNLNQEKILIHLYKSFKF